MSTTSFLAIISPVKNAIAFDGQDGAHLHLDTPATENVCVAALIPAINKVVKVTVEWGDEEVEPVAVDDDPSEEDGQSVP